MTYKNDEWNKWTLKSSGTPFKSTETSIGDGENKLGKEYDTIPLGQNFSYDLQILDERWEVKKLDADNSFRLGVKVSTDYMQIVATVIRILDTVLIINEQLLDSKTGNEIKLCTKKISEKTGRCNTLLLDGLRKNEVAESNLDKANEIIEILKKLLIDEEKTVKLFSSFDGKKYDYELLKAFKKISIENISIKEKVSIFGFEDTYNRLLITDALGTDLKVFENESLREVLNIMVRKIFDDVKLVLVHETKGYRPISNSDSIFCNRITSGNPRCKVL
jgi:hypothetical protein